MKISSDLQALERRRHKDEKETGPGDVHALPSATERLTVDLVKQGAEGEAAVRAQSVRPPQGEGATGIGADLVRGTSTAGDRLKGVRECQRGTAGGTGEVLRLRQHATSTQLASGPAIETAPTAPQMMTAKWRRRATGNRVRLIVEQTCLGLPNCLGSTLVRACTLCMVHSLTHLIT